MTCCMTRAMHILAQGWSKAGAWHHPCPMQCPVAPHTTYIVIQGWIPRSGTNFVNTLVRALVHDSSAPPGGAKGTAWAHQVDLSMALESCCSIGERVNQKAMQGYHKVPQGGC